MATTLAHDQFRQAAMPVPASYGVRILLALALLLPLLFVGGLAAYGMILDGRGNAEAGPQASARLHALTEGKQAELLGAGASARQRNAEIAFARIPLEKLRRFTAIASGTENYANALKCMTQAIYYEAALEPEQGQRAVAQVVLNRMRHPAYPNSVCGVVYEGANDPVCQFSFTCDGSLLREPDTALWARARNIAAAALSGTVEQSVGTATHYHADYVLPRWAYAMAKIEQLGTHIFYRFPGQAGSAKAFQVRWSGREIIPLIDLDRLRHMLDAKQERVEAPEFVPGLTVTAHVADRHADDDVGGRIDTTKSWRLTIPDPVSASAGYQSAISEQGLADADGEPLN